MSSATSIPCSSAGPPSLESGITFPSSAKTRGRLVELPSAIFGALLSPEP
jgi:hypothetical protein